MHTDITIHLRANRTQNTITLPRGCCTLVFFCTNMIFMLLLPGIVFTLSAQSAFDACALCISKGTSVETSLGCGHLPWFDLKCLLIIGAGYWVQVFSLILSSSVGLSAGIQSAGDPVPETLGSNPAFSKVIQLVSFRKSPACARAWKLMTTNMYWWYFITITDIIIKFYTHFVWVNETI